MNSLNQYTQRSIPGRVDVLGSATNTAIVSVNNQRAYRKGEYYRHELLADNASGPVYQSITNVGVLNNGTNADTVTNITGNLLVPKTPETFTHDLDGNLTNDGLWTNAWNGENRIIATESLSTVPSSARAKETWSYMPDGRWLERVTYSWSGSSYLAQSTNRFVWDANVLLAILDHTNGVVTSFMRGLDLSGTPQDAGGAGGLLATTITGNGTHFAAFDGNGDVAGLVNASDGKLSAVYEYAPFGTTLRETGIAAKQNPVRFSTQYADDVTGDAKYLHRDYQPDQGRWKSRDAIGEPSLQIFVRERERFQLYAENNLYGFVANSPISSIDYLGLDINENIGKLKTTIPGSPQGSADVVVLNGTAQGAYKIHGNIKLIGREDESEIGPIPTGLTKWLPLGGDTASGTACRLKYTCLQNCACAFGAFSKEWSTGGYVMGRVASWPVIDATGQQAKNQAGEWVWKNAKCIPHKNSLLQAQADCKATSKGKCDSIEVRLGR